MRFFILSILTLVCTLSYGNTKLPEHGKPDAGWFADNPYAADSSVHAYMIAQDQKSSLMYNTNDGFGVRTATRRVIRILDAKGYDQSVIRILLYDPEEGSGKTILRGLKASTFNQESGEVTATKVEKDDIYRKRLNPVFSEVTFSFPKVSAGSVLDMEWEVFSNGYLYVPTAYLQSTIPIQHASFTLRSNKHFDFGTRTAGYYPVYMKERTAGSKGSRIKANERVVTFEAQEVPAIAEEAFITTLDNYVAQVQVELRGYYPPNGIGRDFSSNWKAIVSRLSKDTDLKAAIAGKGYFKKLAATLPNSVQSEAEKAEWALQQVRKTLRWNKQHSVYPRGSAADAAKAAEGNSADLNTQFIGICTALGLLADPVYISTRDHGRLVELLPARQALNAMIAQVRIEDETLFVDATDPMGILGMLPERDLNGKGIAVRNGGYKFVDLQKGVVAQHAIQASLVLGDDGYLTGEASYMLRGCAAANVLTLSNGQSNVEPKDLPMASSYAVSNLKLEHVKDDQYEVHCSLKSLNPVIDLGDALALSPVVGSFRSSNPFFREERLYPVEFPHRQVETRNITIQLPEGMRIESKPEPVAVATPDRKTQYRYTFKEEEGTITLSTMLVVKNLVYLPEDYPGLRQIFTTVAEKEAELVSLTQ